MVLVNNPGFWGKSFNPLKHASWNGCTLADLVFPFFLFIVGFTIGLVLNRDIELPRKQTLQKIIIRTLAIFFIGLALNLTTAVFNNQLGIEKLRIMGILQRIAICYFLVAIFYVFFKDIWSLALCITAIIFVYEIIIRLWGFDFTKGNNLHSVVDLAVFGKNHIYHHGGGIEPEGLVSTLGALTTTLLGLLSFQVFYSHKNLENLVTTVIGFFALGWIFSFVEPLNKQIYTTAYTFLTAGFASLVLLIVYSLSMGNTKKVLQPFVVLGRNALFIFVLSSALAKLLALE